MNRYVLAVILSVTIICMSFWIVFAFHAQTPTQVQVKEFLYTGEGTLPFASDANAHMRDVQEILHNAAVITALLVFISLALISRFGIPKETAYLCAAIVILLALIPWDTVFTQLHEALFPQGNWRFAPDSFLLETYPMRFFQVFAAVWGALVLLFGTSSHVVRSRVHCQDDAERAS